MIEGRRVGIPKALMATDKDHEPTGHCGSGNNCMNGNLTLLHYTEEAEALVYCTALRINIDLNRLGLILDVVHGVQLSKIIVVFINL